MTALVGCVLSYALLIAGGGAGSTDAAAQADICASGGPTCAPDAAGAPDPLAAYATPVQVDCPSPTTAFPTAAVGATAGLVGGCDLPTFDFHYRVSRFPDSEKPPGTLRPQRPRTPSRPLTVSARLPRHDGSVVSAAFTPVALYASTALSPPAQAGSCPERAGQSTTRVLEPLDRPPRA